MANLASAEKRNKQNESRRVRNRARKSKIKTGTRKLLDAIHDGELQTAQEAYRQVSRTIDQVCAKGAVHRNAAARKKSRLARKLNAALAAVKQ